LRAFSRISGSDTATSRASWHVGFEGLSPDEVDLMVATGLRYAQRGVALPEAAEKARADVLRTS
jgi:hypothetical protein